MMLEVIYSPFDRFIHKIRFRHLSNQTRCTIVGGIRNFIAHKKLLTNNPQAGTAFRHSTLKPSHEFSGAILRVIGVRIIESKVYFHCLNPSYLVKTIANRYGLAGKYSMIFILLRS